AGNIGAGCDGGFPGRPVRPRRPRPRLLRPAGPQAGPLLDELSGSKNAEMPRAQGTRLRFGGVTKTRGPEVDRYWTTRDRAANGRLYRLMSEVVAKIEAGAAQGVPVQGQVLGVAVNRRGLTPG